VQYYVTCLLHLSKHWTSIQVFCRYVNCPCVERSWSCEWSRLQGVLHQDYIIELVVRPWEASDPRNHGDGCGMLANIQPVHEDEQGNCYFRRQASLVKVRHGHQLCSMKLLWSLCVSQTSNPSTTLMSQLPNIRNPKNIIGKIILLFIFFPLSLFITETGYWWLLCETGYWWLLC